MSGQHIADLPLTANSISSFDSVNTSEGWPPSAVNNAFRAMASAVKDDFARSANTITAASTFTLASISTGDYVRMAPPSGASITSFGPATDGLQKFLESTGTTILRNGASLSVQGGADITLSAGDLVWARRDQSVWKARIWYADGPHYQLLQTKSGSISASVVDLTISNLNYRAYKIFIANLQPGTDATDISMRFSGNGGTTFSSSASDYAFTRAIMTDTGTGPTVTADTGFSSITLAANLGGSSGNEFNAEVTLFAPATGVHPKATWTGSYVNPAGVFIFTDGGGRKNETLPVNAVRFLMSSGVIASGTFAIYGIR